MQIYLDDEKDFHVGFCRIEFITVLYHQYVLEKNRARCAPYGSKNRWDSTVLIQSKRFRQFCSTGEIEQFGNFN